MSDVQITGYHTCKTEGGWSYLRCEAPFLSGSGENQWLTQGYYFWTDSDHFAHKWGKDSYNSDYAIIKCKIVIGEDFLLDLVGSTQAQMYFERLLSRYRSKLHVIDQGHEPTVQAVIAHWRKKAEKHPGVFPFSAIKAQDRPRGAPLPFTSNGKHEVMYVGIQRQQLCLFECGFRFLKEKNIIHPQEFIRS